MTNYDKVQMMLNSYIEWITDVENISLEIEAIQNDYDIAGIEIKEKTGQTYKINNEIETKIINKPEKIKNLEKIKESNMTNIKRLENSLKVLSEFEAKVIQLKYLNSPTASWKTVAYKLNSSISSCRQAKIRAIKKMIPRLCR